MKCYACGGQGHISRGEYKSPQVCLACQLIPARLHCSQRRTPQHGRQDLLQLSRKWPYIARLPQQARQWRTHGRHGGAWRRRPRCRFYRAGCTCCSRRLDSSLQSIAGAHMGCDETNDHPGSIIGVVSFHLYLDISILFSALLFFAPCFFPR